MSRFLFIALFAALAAGCASQPAWHKPGAKPEELDRALHNCRVKVAEEMRSERDYREQSFGRGASDLSNTEAAGTQAARDRIYEAGAFRVRDRLLEDCMRSNGFLPARDK